MGLDDELAKVFPEPRFRAGHYESSNSRDTDDFHTYTVEYPTEKTFNVVLHPEVVKEAFDWADSLKFDEKLSRLLHKDVRIGVFGVKVHL